MRCFTRCVWISAIVLAVVASAERARAEVFYYESIEWLTDVVESIGRYRAETVSKVVEEDEHWQRRKYRVDAVLVEALKGVPPERVSFDVHRSVMKSIDEATPDVTAGTEFVRLLVPSAKNENRRVRGLICLRPSIWPGPLTKHFDRLETRESILATIRARLDFNRKSDRAMPPVGFDPLGQRARQGRGYLFLEPPPDKKTTTPYRLVVPADPDVKEFVLERLRSSTLRQQATAARRLAAFPGEETVRVLKELLDHPESTDWRVFERGADKARVIRVYPVRYAAYCALHQLGVEIEPPEGLPDEPLFHDRF